MSHQEQSLGIQPITFEYKDDTGQGWELTGNLDARLWVHKDDSPYFDWRDNGDGRDVSPILRRNDTTAGITGGFEPDAQGALYAVKKIDEDKLKIHKTALIYLSEDITKLSKVNEAREVAGAPEDAKFFIDREDATVEFEWDE